MELNFYTFSSISKTKSNHTFFAFGLDNLSPNRAANTLTTHGKISMSMKLVDEPGWIFTSKTLSTCPRDEIRMDYNFVHYLIPCG